MHDAIERARDLLIDATPAGHDPLTCDRCGGEMQVRSTQVQEDPCRNDVRVKCMDCYWWTRHGVPIERPVYESELDSRDHRLVDAVNTDTDEPHEKRLKDLGYLDA